MSNTLTGLIPTLYEALNTVSREMVGFIPAVRRDTSADRAAVSQTVRVPLAVAGALEAITPGSQGDSGDTTVSYADITIASSYAAPIRWTGEEERAVGTTGTYNRVLADQFADGMRKLVNAVELSCFTAAYTNSSRAYGTAGTAPFGTANNLTDLAGVAAILDANGCPVSDRQLVVGSAAIANLRGLQAVLFKVNEAGSADMLRTGMTDRLQNMALRYSGQITAFTKGAGTGYDVDLTAGYVVGDTTIHLDGGTVNTTGIKAGDVITFAGDTNKYIVTTGTTAVEADIVIGKPGLLATLADTVEATIGNSYTPNVAFDRNAIVLVTRAPAVPTGGDSADDAMMITDPITGLTFEVRVYRQYRRVKYEVCLAWGAAVVNQQHVATLLG
jgi:hypothetical protein